MKRPSRVPTTLAVGFLSLDALLLLYAGLGWRRPLLTAAGCACAVAGACVIVAWRRYRRTLMELDAAHRDMQHEIESIREMLQSQHSHN